MAKVKISDFLTIFHENTFLQKNRLKLPENTVFRPSILKITVKNTPSQISMERNAKNDQSQNFQNFQIFFYSDKKAKITLKHGFWTLFLPYFYQN